MKLLLSSFHTNTDHVSYSQKSTSTSALSSRQLKRSQVVRKTSSQEPPEAHIQTVPHREAQHSVSLGTRKISHSENSSDGEAQSSSGSCMFQ